MIDPDKAYVIPPGGLKEKINIPIRKMGAMSLSGAIKTPSSEVFSYAEEAPKVEVKVAPPPAVADEKPKKPTVKLTKPKKAAVEKKTRSDTEERAPVSQDMFAEMHELMSAFREYIDISQAAAVTPGDAEQDACVEEKVAQQTEQFLIKYVIDGFGDISLPVDSVLRTSNSTILMIGNKIDSGKMEVTPSPIGSDAPSIVSIVVGVDCADPVVFKQLARIGEVIIQPLKMRYQVYLSLSAIEGAIRAVKI